MEGHQRFVMRGVPLLAMTLFVGLILPISPPKDDAERWRRYDLVRVTVNADQVRGCKSLGLVELPSFVPVDPQQRGHDHSHREEKWGTMEAGGDTVLLTAAGAEAYRCVAPKRTKKARRARALTPRPSLKR